METTLEVSPVMNGTNGFSQRARRPLNEQIADQEFPDVDLESIKRAVRTILNRLEIRETDTSVISYTREDWEFDNRYLVNPMRSEKSQLT